MKLSTVQQNFLDCISYTGPINPMSPDDPGLIKSQEESKLVVSKCITEMTPGDFTPEFCELVESKYKSLPDPGKVVVFRCALTCPAGKNLDEYMATFKMFYNVSAYHLTKVFGTSPGVQGVKMACPPYVSLTPADENEEERVFYTSEEEIEDLRRRYEPDSDQEPDAEPHVGPTLRLTGLLCSSDS